MALHVRLTDAQRQHVRDLVAAGLTPAPIAKRLGLKPTQIAATYRAAIREGLAPKRSRQPWQPWTAKDIDQLYNLIDKGLSYAAIAKKLKRTETSVKLKAKRLNYRLLSSGAALTARDVATLLGKKCSKSVAYWIRHCGLKATNAGRPKRSIWRVQWEDLTDWIAQPEHWMAYDPNKIADSALREWALEIRVGGPRWISQETVAKRYHVGVDTVRQWIDKGWIVAARYGNHWVDERSLGGWAPPCAMSRAEWDDRHWPRDRWQLLGFIGGVEVRKRAA